MRKTYSVCLAVPCFSVLDGWKLPRRPPRLLSSFGCKIRELDAGYDSIESH